MDQAAPSSFLSLPSEIRAIIYREIFSHRSVILTRRVTQVDRWGWKHDGGRVDYCVDEPGCRDGSTIPLLQTCKHIFAEAQPIHLKYAPSHLKIDQAYGSLPNLPRMKDLEVPLGVPMAYITRLTFHATNLGPNKKEPKKCPGTEMEDFILSDCRIERFPEPLPKRLPNLKSISELSCLINDGLPAVREVHIRDVLEHGIKGISDPCDCPKAGTSSCMCGQCKCTCTIVAPLLGPETECPRELMHEFHEDLVSRYRAALPMPKFGRDNTALRDWSAMLQLLDRGTHFYLHDQIVPSNLSNAADAQDKRMWSATYHLVPPVAEDEIGPVDPPTRSIESPRTRRSEGRAYPRTYSNEFELDFSTLENADVLEHFDFDSFIDGAYLPPSPPSLPSPLSDADDERTLFEGKALVDFEDCVRIQLVDELF